MRRPNFSSAVLLVIFIITAVAYIPINHSAHAGHQLTSLFDAHIPFIPLFVVPYLFLIPVFWSVLIYSFLTGKNFHRLLLAVLAVYLASDLIYLIFQTYMPRPDHVSGLFAGAVQYVYRHDRPYCDLPSEHAASAALLALYCSSIGSRFKNLIIGFSLSVVLATVFIKQHSIIGAALGVFLAYVAWQLAPLALKRVKH